MFCKSCRNEIIESSKFCEFCGRKVEVINQVLNLKARESLFNKKAFSFWLLVIGMALLIVSFVGDTKSFSDKMLVLPFIYQDDFEIFLRFYIFSISLYFGFLKYKESKVDTSFLFVALGILFNPFVPFMFEDDFQDIVTFSTAVFFGYLCYREYQRVSVNERSVSH